MTPAPLTPEERTKKICQEFRKRFKEDKGCVCDFIAAQIREAEQEAILRQYEGEMSPVAIKEHEAFEKGFNAAKEKAAKIADNEGCPDDLGCAEVIAKEILQMEIE